MEPNEVAQLFNLVFKTPSGQAALAHLEKIYNQPTAFENANREFFNAGRRSVLADIRKFITMDTTKKE